MKLAAVAFVAGKTANIPRDIAAKLGGAGKAVNRAAAHARHDVVFGAKQIRNKLPRRKPHVPKTKMGKKFAAWRQKMRQWFKDQGPRYQSRMNAVLRSFMVERQKKRVR